MKVKSSKATTTAATRLKVCVFRVFPSFRASAAQGKQTTLLLFFSQGQNLCSYHTSMHFLLLGCCCCFFSEREALCKVDDVEECSEDDEQVDQRGDAVQYLELFVGVTKLRASSCAVADLLLQFGLQPHHGRRLGAHPEHVGQSEQQTWCPWMERSPKCGINACGDQICRGGGVFACDQGVQLDVMGTQAALYIRGCSGGRLQGCDANQSSCTSRSNSEVPWEQVAAICREIKMRASNLKYEGTASIYLCISPNCCLGIFLNMIMPN